MHSVLNTFVVGWVNENEVYTKKQRRIDYLHVLQQLAEVNINLIKSNLNAARFEAIDAYEKDSSMMPKVKTKDTSIKESLSVAVGKKLEVGG